MKVCPDCHASNTNASTSCATCGSCLSEAKPIKASEALKRCFAMIDRREKRKKNAFMAMKTLAVCAEAALLIFAIWAAVIGRIPVDILVWVLVMAFLGLLLLLLPRESGFFSFMFREATGFIKNPETAEPNEYFFFRYRLGGAVFIIGSVVLLGLNLV